MKKTIQMKVTKKLTNIKMLKTCFQKYERVKEFKHLGTFLAKDCITTEKKERIIMAAENSYWSKKQLNLRNFKFHTKCMLHKTPIKPTLACGSECWPLSK
jgi:hypothetical protein